ncbi:MAG: hypothetical protein VX639_10605, partial [Pseudomonadota bacterium]|nr:hypothetical protein [Pseudomonadota bacterium]
YPTPEIGAVTHFEHVNYRVPDHGPAMLFFCEGLGFTRDPMRMVGTRNMWINAGRQQFHMPRGEASPFPGEVGVSVKDIKRVHRNMKRIACELKGTEFSIKEVGKTLTCTSPWGHVLRVHQAGQLSGRMPQAISYVNFWVPVGTAKTIADFYEKMVYAPTEVAKRGKHAMAVVTVGANQHFHFIERPDYEPVDHPNHVAIYVTRYREMYRQFKAKKMLMRPDVEEQFRFEKIFNPRSGKIVFSFEHEVRSLYHPDYLKPLTNRVPVPYLVD